MTQDFCDSVTDAQKQLHKEMRRDTDTRWQERQIHGPTERSKIVAWCVLAVVVLAVVIIGSISIWRGMK